MSKSTASIRSNLIYPAVIISVFFAVVGVSAWTATSSPALSFYNEAVPTHSRSFAVAEIAKPTYTPLPTALPTSTPLPTDIPGEPTALAQIVPGDSAFAVNGESAGPAELAAPPSYGGNKSILVDISEQHMYVYEGDVLVYSFVASTGMNNATSVGSFSVLDKIPNAYGATWNIWMPNWLGIYWAGTLENGIHALPILPNGATLWAGYLGVPISYGCIVLGTYEAQQLYDWADVGTPVNIQW
jgi:lipoprotein-anchoring transpeptidase ErfK/SrfK